MRALYRSITVRVASFAVLNAALLAFSGQAATQPIDLPSQLLIERAKAGDQSALRIRVQPSLDVGGDQQRAIVAAVAASIGESATPQTLGMGTFRINVLDSVRALDAFRMHSSILWAELDREPNASSAEARMKLAIDPSRATRRMLVAPANYADLLNDGAARDSFLASIATSTGIEFEFVGRSILDYWEINSREAISLVELSDAESRVRAAGIVIRALAGYPVTADLTPNDPLSPNGGQWNLYPPGGAIYGISAQRAWDLTTGNPNLVVAVVDTGILPHPDLAGRVIQGIDLIHDPARGNDGNGADSNPTDPGDWVTAGQCGNSPAKTSSWHGTHVAGIIGAATNNGLGVAGINWNSKIQPVRVLGRCGGDTIDILMGMVWASGIDTTSAGIPTNPTPARVINMSLGGPGQCTEGYQAIVDSVLATGALVVAAAGNENSLADNRVPASCFGLSTVGATDPLGFRASYSNVSFFLDISAPGGDISRYGPSGGILSTHNDGATTAGNFTYDPLQGTSMAAPHVSGVASLMLSVNPSLTPAQLKALMALTSTTFNPESACTIGICGAGIVNAENAVLAALLVSGQETFATVVEYRHTIFNHYFITAQADEIAGLDAGAFGGVFQRTGQTWKVWASGTGKVNVCRFFTVFFAPKSSHFYTANSVECEGLKASPVWQYEKLAFKVALPSGGACPTGTQMLYRLYNNGQTGAPNHRYTTSLTIRSQMIAQGFVPEDGNNVCVPL